MKLFYILTNHIYFGDEGENIACEYLRNKGYEILEKKWRYKHKEIDIIAFFESTIVFVEVKCRSSDIFCKPEEAVTETKQQHLIDAAEAYIEKSQIENDCRFDVISIIKSKDVMEIKHIIEAF
jgi:putative endonuclease